MNASPARLRRLPRRLRCRARHAGLDAAGWPTWRRRSAAFLKLAHGRPNSFLLESVEGGAARGRYSIIGMEPDLIWRCRGGRAEINRHARSAPHAFVADERPALDSLRALIAETPHRRAGRPAADVAAGWSAISATTWSG